MKNRTTFRYFYDGEEPEIMQYEFTDADVERYRAFYFDILPV